MCQASHGDSGLSCGGRIGELAGDGWTGPNACRRVLKSPRVTGVVETIHEGHFSRLCYATYVMDFEFSDEQKQLRKHVREFAEAEIAPHVLEWDESQIFPLEVIKKCGELGFLRGHLS